MFPFTFTSPSEFAAMEPGRANGIPTHPEPPPPTPIPPPPRRDHPDDDEAPETPPSDPPPVPVQDPPSEPGKRGPFVV